VSYVSTGEKSIAGFGIAVGGRGKTRLTSGCASASGQRGPVGDGRQAGHGGVVSHLSRGANCSTRSTVASDATSTTTGLVAELDRLESTGVDVQRMVLDAAAQRPLPDVMPAAALKYRLIDLENDSPRHSRRIP
jgi:hypothetical protein